jgi:uncharacterized membrane protein YhaH (DUF805 family)
MNSESCSFKLGCAGEGKMESFYTKPKNIVWLLFSFEGRANLTQFWVGHFFYRIVAAFAVGAMWGLAGILHHFAIASESDFLIYLVIGFWALLFIAIYIAVWIKRLHGLGVQSRHLMDWIKFESFGLICPYLADAFVRGEAF